jgi:non-ribosomal peptide synthetase component F
VISNQLARYLKKGVEAESSVGICLERSPEMIVALLAVLSGRRLPSVGSSYPPERLRLMLNKPELHPY